MTETERERLRALARRLQATRDPEVHAVCAELARIANHKVGRLPDPPDERARRRLKRVLVAEALYAGTLPESLVPEEHRDSIQLARGNRDEADVLAGKLLHVSLDTIRDARRGRRAPGDADRVSMHVEADELIALARIAAGWKPPKA